MDEVLFRSSQKMESLQMHLGLAATRSKEAFLQYSDQGKSLMLQALQSPRSIELQESIKKVWEYLIELTQELKYKVTFYVDPRRIYVNLLQVFSRKLTKRDLLFVCAGFICGGVIGIAIGLAVRKRDNIIRYMEAVQCSHYLGPESAVIVEDAIAPYECGENDVLVNVKAASVNYVDLKITNGYGKYYRKLLRRLYEGSSSDLPVTLGRDCTGIVTDVGINVTRIGVGDEVWLTAPFWAKGTLSQSVLSPELRVARRPKNFSFEAVSSLPYAGSLALTALKKTDVTFENAQDKRILVHGGCTAVGCALIQILKHWGADVTTTCTKRAFPVAKALGADDIIQLVYENEQENHISTTSEMESDCEVIRKTILKELELREKFNVIILTSRGLNPEELETFCTSSDGIVSTLPEELFSDGFGFFGRFFIGSGFYLKFYLEKFLGVPLNEYDEAHMCYASLDYLTELVENGHLQTVVDKVFQPGDIEIALNHIQSPHSIGSTVISFK